MKTFRDHNPAASAQWHPTKNGELTPDNVSFGSRKRVWWLCHNGHEWETEVASRRNRSECPTCVSATKAPRRSLALNPDLIRESVLPIDEATPYQARLLWRCAKGHEWHATLQSRSAGAPCPYCSGRKPIKGENDLSTTHPELAKLWAQDNARSPETVFAHSNIVVSFFCSHGHRWEEPVRYLVRRGGCSECIKGTTPPYKKVDLVETHPQIAALLVDSSTHTSRGSEKVLEWKCGFGKDHTFSMRVHNRIRHGADYCLVCSYQKRISLKELSLYQVLSALTTATPVQGDYSLIKSELDLYFPQYNLAVEFNGLYWHSDDYKPRSYHYRKTMDCLSKGVQLLHVWEDDWDSRRDLVIRTIAAKMGISDRLSEETLDDYVPLMTDRLGARKLRLVAVSKEEAEPFFVKNHIQGFTSGTAYLAGKDDAGNLRAVLTIKKSGIPQRPHEWRIERYATLGIISGGFTRLLSFAEKYVQEKLELPIDSWVTFSDNAISDGSLYLRSHFTRDKEIAPDYAYIVDDKRVHKFNYRLRRFKKDGTLLWQEGLTETELARLNGLTRIWDAGKIRWRKKVVST